MSNIWGRQKPTAGTILNFSHPLASGLTSFSLLNNIADVIPNLFIAGTWQPNGLLLNTNPQAITIPTKPNSPTTTGSFFCVLRTGFSDVQATFNVIYDSDTIRNVLFHNSSSEPFYMANDGRNALFNNVVFSLGQTITIATSWDKTSDTQNLNVNNVDYVATSRSGTWGSNSLGAYYYVGNRFTLDTTASSFFHCFYFWNRIISPSEIGLLNDDPYCIFGPPQPYKRYFIPSISTGSILFGNCYCR